MASQHLEPNFSSGRWKRLVKLCEIPFCQAQVNRAAVLADVIWLTCTRNSNDPFVSEYPGESHLGRGGAVSFSHLLQFVMTEHPSLLDW